MANIASPNAAEPGHRVAHAGQPLPLLLVGAKARDGEHRGTPRGASLRCLVSTPSGRGAQASCLRRHRSAGHGTPRGASLRCLVSTPSGRGAQASCLRRHRSAGHRRIGIDEISYKRHHRYLTVVVDHDSGRLVWAAPGRPEPPWACSSMPWALSGPPRLLTFRPMPRTGSLHRHHHHPTGPNCHHPGSRRRHHQHRYGHRGPTTPAPPPSDRPELSPPRQQTPPPPASVRTPRSDRPAADAPGGAEPGRTPGPPVAVQPSAIARPHLPAGG